MTKLYSRPSFRTHALVALGALALVAAAAATIPPAGAESASSSGAFDEYAAGPGLGYTDIAGHAQLVRTADGRSISTVEVRGLHRDATYAAHIHVGSCSDLGGHYFLPGAVANGDGPASDEIWPGPVTANAAGNARGSTAVDATAGPTARSVVIHSTPTGGPRIACADLT